MERLWIACAVVLLCFVDVNAAIALVGCYTVWAHCALVRQTGYVVKTLTCWGAKRAWSRVRSRILLLRRHWVHWVPATAADAPGSTPAANVTMRRPRPIGGCSETS
jgi:hypothetical protein